MRCTRTLLRHRILYFGSNNISTVCLQTLYDDLNGDKSFCKQIEVVGHDGVDVLKYAKWSGIRPHAIKNEALKGWEVPAGDWDVGVVVSFRHFIPSSVIKKFRKGMINLHPSLLPKYRGASPIQETIRQGDQIGGISIIKICPKEIMDTGDILLQKEIKIPPEQCFPQYFERVADVGADSLAHVLKNFESYYSNAIPQTNKVRKEFDDTFASIITRDDCYVRPQNFNSMLVYNSWRAFQLNGGIWLHYKGLRSMLIALVHETKIPQSDLQYLNSLPPASPGSLVFPSSGKSCSFFYIRFQDSWLGCSRIHIACQKPKSAVEFMTGFRYRAKQVYEDLFT